MKQRPGEAAVGDALIRMVGLRPGRGDLEERAFAASDALIRMVGLRLL